MKNSLVLKVEGLIVLAFSLYVYFSLGYSIMWLVVLLLTPDISMVGYLKDKKVGAFVYNLGHTYVFSLALLFIGFFLNISPLLTYGLIWTMHIGMDRMLGYGLKYPTSFQDTHIQKT